MILSISEFQKVCESERFRWYVLDSVNQLQHTSIFLYRNTRAVLKYSKMIISPEFKYICFKHQGSFLSIDFVKYIQINKGFIPGTVFTIVCGENCSNENFCYKFIAD